MIPAVPALIRMVLALPLLLLSMGFCAAAEWVSPELFKHLDDNVGTRDL